MWLHWDLNPGPLSPASSMLPSELWTTDQALHCKICFLTANVNLSKWFTLLNNSFVLHNENLHAGNYLKHYSFQCFCDESETFSFVWLCFSVIGHYFCTTVKVGFHNRNFLCEEGLGAAKQKFVFLLLCFWLENI